MELIFQVRYLGLVGKLKIFNLFLNSLLARSDVVLLLGDDGHEVLVLFLLFFKGFLGLQELHFVELILLGPDGFLLLCHQLDRLDLLTLLQQLGLQILDGLRGSFPGVDEFSLQLLNFESVLHLELVGGLLEFRSGGLALRHVVLHGGLLLGPGLLLELKLGLQFLELSRDVVELLLEIALGDL